MGRQQIGRLAGQVLVAGLLAAAILAACFLAPTESTMGHAQRIVYVHVPVAWLGLLAFLTMAGSGLAYLARRDLKWDHWFQAAGELGWLCCGLTLVTGSLWAHEAWGTWWEWDPRLTTAFILWVIYSGVLLARAGIEDPHRRARSGAILAILGALDVPLVVMATRWFRGLHPVSPEMAPLMRTTLLISVVGFTVFFAWLAGRRREQLELEIFAAELQRQVEG
jgi:heme exporter protein C